MHPFSVLTLGIFVAGYITARWDLVTRLYELAIFAWDHGVVTRTAKGFLFLSVFFFLLVLPINHLASKEGQLVSNTGTTKALGSDRKVKALGASLGIFADDIEGYIASAPRESRRLRARTIAPSRFVLRLG
ncbi:N-acetylglucosaminyl transferase component [Penicillium hordei]|uniref:N-acetylglucosaminyl transferase component n=1 Tax=Penicillium hordei TaxID=40994 RepID=A0AAD6EFK1_9EURO|nr:N-acetylglucosaminyl transferase component [Penicillium hordei]KAJ5616338.1 N-acetylglucosaminyl transferase component [Penicillium hordei]